MARPLVDRRLDERFRQPDLAGTEAILRPGYVVSLLDLSAGGALIQGPRPFRPGARVHLQLLTGKRRLALSAHVLRCSVAALDTPEGVQYRGALQFDTRCESLREGATLNGYLVPGDDETMMRAEGHVLPDSLPPGQGATDRDRK